MKKGKIQRTPSFIEGPIPVPQARIIQTVFFALRIHLHITSNNSLLSVRRKNFSNLALFPHSALDLVSRTQARTAIERRVLCLAR
jgi:hypothetical protein